MTTDLTRHLMLHITLHFIYYGQDWHALPLNVVFMHAYDDIDACSHLHLHAKLVILLVCACNVHIRSTLHSITSL